MSYGREDYMHDEFLEAACEDKYPEPYEEPDYETFERNQLDLDRYYEDEYYQDDEDEDEAYEYDPDLENELV